MALRCYRSIIPAAVMVLATPACAALTVPPSGDAVTALRGPSAGASHSRPADMKSVLAHLTKDIVIGSTVDSGNGDQGPRALSIVPRSFKNGILQEGQLLFCNFEDSSGNAGNGTTIEALNPLPNSTPQRFVQSNLLKGCVGAAINANGGATVYGAGLTSGKLVEISKRGAVAKTYGGKIFNAPFSDIVTNPAQDFSPLYVYTGTTHGGIVSVSVGFYGNGKATEVAKGFGLSDGSQGELAPSGFQYDQASDTLYIVDGATNTIVAFSNSSELLDKDEIIVKPGGKTFKCKYPKTTCASLVYSGSPLDAPVASALLPNGNLIIANTRGTANTLVELTPQGQVLYTKVVDSSSTQGVFGLAAQGTSDSNTVLFFTDTNTNTVQELTR